MGFRNPQLIPISLITAFMISLGIGGYCIHKKMNEGREAVQQEATQDNILISQQYNVKIDSSLSRANSNYKSVIFGLGRLSEKLDSVHYELVGLHEDMVALNKRDSIRASLDSVASSP